MHRLTFLFLAAGLALAGCTTTQVSKLPDGSEIGLTSHTQPFAPSVTIVTFKQAGTTNFTNPQVIGGQGALPALSYPAGVALQEVFWHNEHHGSGNGGSVNVNANGGSGGNASATGGSATGGSATMHGPPAPPPKRPKNRPPDNRPRDK